MNNNYFEINKLYLNKSNGIVAKSLALINSPSMGKVYLLEDLMSGKMIGIPLYSTRLDDWIEVIQDKEDGCNYA